MTITFKDMMMMVVVNFHYSTKNNGDPEMVKNLRIHRYKDLDGDTEQAPF